MSPKLLYLRRLTLSPFCYSQVSATASWDSSVHDSLHLNRVTPQNERIYLIVKATVQLSHPATMELVLRKRIAANIYNKQVVTGLTGHRVSKGTIVSSVACHVL